MLVINRQICSIPVWIILTSDVFKFYFFFTDRTPCHPHEPLRTTRTLSVWTILSNMPSEFCLSTPRTTTRVEHAHRKHWLIIRRLSGGEPLLFIHYFVTIILLENLKFDLEPRPKAGLRPRPQESWVLETCVLSPRGRVLGLKQLLTLEFNHLESSFRFISQLFSPTHTTQRNSRGSPVLFAIQVCGLEILKRLKSFAVDFIKIVRIISVIYGKALYRDRPNYQIIYALCCT